MRHVCLDILTFDRESYTQGSKRSKPITTIINDDSNANLLMMSQLHVRVFRDRVMLTVVATDPVTC